MRSGSGCNYDDASTNRHELRQIASETATMNGSELYQRGREAFERGEYELALALLRESWDDTIHFKTMSRIGEVLCLLGRHREAVAPLAAATALNRG